MELHPDFLYANRYRLLKQKGRGSFGEVWLARDEQLDLEVAIKVYIALDDRGLSDFQAEYKTVYGLNHPNLLRADHFDICDRRPYLVMPYCPDSALSLVGTTDESTLWRFIRDVSAGLSYLHAQEPPVVHRDITPDNILIDRHGHFLITDFGISTRLRSTLRRNSTRDMANSAGMTGTIAYMAPELFTSRPEAVKATDIWALGATLCELIQGELPFVGQGGVMQKNGAEIPELPSHYSQQLRDVVAACLAPETWDRPTAEQLVAVAEAVLKGEKPSIKWKSRQDSQNQNGTADEEKINTSERNQIKYPRVKPTGVKSNNHKILFPAIGIVCFPAIGIVCVLIISALVLITSNSHESPIVEETDSVVQLDSVMSIEVVDSCSREIEQSHPAEMQPSLTAEQEQLAQQRKAEAMRQAEQQRKMEETEQQLRAEKARLAEENQHLQEQARLANELECRKNKGVYQAGDYYNINGVQGVVFDVDALGKHGKIVGMSYSGWLEWCSDEQGRVATYATDRYNGMSNQRKVMQIDGWRTKYPAFAWCASLGAGWYLPAIEELKFLVYNDRVRNAVDQTLKMYNGQTMKHQAFFWSSTENDDNCRNASRLLYNGNANVPTKNIDDFYKDQIQYVRAVHSF